MTSGLNGTVAGPTIPASAETLVRFQFGRGTDDPEREDQPVYLLAGHSEKMASAIRSANTERGIRNPDDDELLRALAFAMDLSRADTDPALFAKFSTILERHKALPAKAEGETDSFDRLAIQGGIEMLYDLCRSSNDRLAALLRKRETWWADSLRTTCAVVLTGWEHHEGTVERIGTEASAATLALISPPIQEQIGLYWVLRGRVTDDQKKTSASLPPSPTAPRTTPRTGGRRRSSTVSSKVSAHSSDTMNGTKATSTTLDT
jgi:hypothetical protein